MKGGEDILENDQKDKDGDNDVTTHDGPTGFWAPHFEASTFAFWPRPCWSIGARAKSCWKQVSQLGSHLGTNPGIYLEAHSEMRGTKK